MARDGLGELSHPVEGLLTCGLVTLFRVAEEARKWEKIAEEKAIGNV